MIATPEWEWGRIGSVRVYLYVYVLCIYFPLSRVRVVWPSVRRYITWAESVAEAGYTAPGPLLKNPPPQAQP